MKIYSCYCLLDKLLAMDREEVIKSLADHSILDSSGDKWLSVIIEGNNSEFSYIVCMQSIVLLYNLDENGFDSCLDACIDFIPFGGVESICDFCLEKIIGYLEKDLIEI